VVTPSKAAKAPAKKKAKRTTAKGKVIEDTDADTGTFSSTYCVMQSSVNRQTTP
jgi:hypothetical protein